MIANLTENDVKELRNQCRMGVVISLLIFLFVSIIGLVIYESNFDSNPDIFNAEMAISISIGAFIFAVILNLILNHRLYADLRNNEKIQTIKLLTSKSNNIDSAHGMGQIVTKAYVRRFEFVVDGISFLVDEKLYKSCFEGDRLIFNYAPKSRYLLGIQKVK